VVVAVSDLAHWDCWGWSGMKHQVHSLASLTEEASTSRVLEFWQGTAGRQVGRFWLVPPGRADSADRPFHS